ncbi:MAG TPA: DUF6677 family protein [Planctomycetaceae bacterium]|nr:DUF6677 family protein [Planctomycetaceae bacterium]
MSAPSSVERRRPWEEKNTVVAGVLAFLIPGLGHFYQGRMFKGLIYFVCILGAYFGGMRLGEGAVVYQSPMGGNFKKVSLTFLGQSGVGLPSLIALYQMKRAEAPANRDLYELNEPISAPFQGRLIASGPAKEEGAGELVGQIELKTSRDGSLPETRGIFKGTKDGEPIELELSGGFKLDRPISGGFRRGVEAHVVHSPDQHPNEAWHIRGSIPRRFVDAFNAPPDPALVQDLHGRLGKFYDLAIAFTLIAGFLNVLAIWDAIEGPAYGWGDEPATAPSTPERNDQPAAAAVVAPSKAPQ